MLSFMFSLWAEMIKMLAEQQSHNFDPLSALLMALALFGRFSFQSQFTRTSHSASFRNVLLRLTQ